MEAIEKLRAMQNWFDLQSEYFNQQFKTIKQLEQIYDYAQANSLEFMDNDYLFSDNLEEEERKTALKFIEKIKKS